MSGFLQDARYALRAMRKAPGFTVVAVSTLALGIGANTAIFSVVNALLIRPLPYARADRLVMVWQDMRARGGPADEWATPGNYADWRKEGSLFEEVAVISGWRPTLTGRAEPEAIPGEQVSHEYFSVLGIRPFAGRTFTEADDVPNAPRVVIIGEGLWRRRFGSDPSIVGTMIPLNGEPHQIIGIAPAAFRPVINAEAQLWRPLRLNTASPQRGAIVLRAVARLPDALRLEQAQSAAHALARRLQAAYPQYNEKVDINITSLHDRVVGDIKPGLLALLGAVAFVLLIACANIANLLLARGSARGREFAVRAALGAGRGRMIRQLLTESLLLAIAGGVAGVLIGVWSVQGLIAMAPANAPRVGDIRIDAAVLAFAALLTIVTGLLFGVVPALQHSRHETTGALKEGGRGSSGAAGLMLRRTLIGVEVALALMLLIGSALLLQTFLRLQSTDLGFDPHNVVVGFVNPPRAAGYDTMQKHRVFDDQVLERVAAIPGVRKAALASVLPLSGDSDMNVFIEGRPVPQSESRTPATWYRLVSASYFDTMGIALKRGRGFEPREAAPSVVVNETFARTFFPGEDPIGHRVRFENSPKAEWFAIIGVAGDVKVRGARGALRIETYVPYWQFTEPGMQIIAKAAADPSPLAEAIKQAVYSIDRNVPVSGVTTLDKMVGESVEQPRFFALLASAFAALALALAAVGIYGVMAYVVSQRTVEIGVRMALGATPGEVFRLVVTDGLKVTSLGILAGIGGSLLITRWLAALLFGVRPSDPLTLGATAALLLMVAIAACSIPARRAIRVDPMVALRAE